MSAAATVACAGAPRDLGLDQGAAGRDAVRAAVARLGRGARLRARLGLDARLARCARDARSHYPHASERLAGLARAAGASRAELAALLAGELATSAAPPAACGEALATCGAEGAALLARSLAAPAAAGPAPWILRTSAPEHDWRSVEVALPWLVPALAGVNERGLAAVGIVRPAPSGSLDRCAAPALLLVQECLQRCDDVGKAIEWCERRPSGGSAALLLADATGDVAVVSVEGERRSVQRPRDGLLVAADGERAASLEKACAARPALDPAALAEVLAAPPTPGSAPRAVVVLDPAARTLALRPPTPTGSTRGVNKGVRPRR